MDSALFWSQVTTPSLVVANGISANRYRIANLKETTQQLGLPPC